MGPRRVVVVTVTALAAWFAIVGRITVAETLAGLVAASLVTAMTEFDRRVADPGATMPTRWWRSLSGLPTDVMRDVGVLASELARTAAGRRSEAGFVPVPVPGRGPGELVLAILGATATPNSVVVGYDTDNETLLVHQLRISEDPHGDVHARLP